ncbi:uncharacterized protein LOC126905819 [Daktulosphaira vitifoliae]|uniref:uncharacterized protein LOC126905819 n=1 Tax=Daktulosphaira vitifoliae TaxID=58002 RepID=UPI0021AABF46|nr:uncharacterized protein LOC126905819 [Daktulosphaira vitifoliae]
MVCSTSNELRNKMQSQLKWNDINNFNKHLNDCGKNKSFCKDFIEVNLHPTTCNEVKDECKISCSSNNPLERIMNNKVNCCIESPIITFNDKSKPFPEKLFSKRTSFQIQESAVEIDLKCICMKFNGLQDKCEHPDCKNKTECLKWPSPICLPAQNWKKYYYE